MAYMTSIRTSVVASPFSIVYGGEAAIPLELEIPSLRASLQGKISYK